MIFFNVFFFPSSYSLISLFILQTLTTHIFLFCFSLFSLLIHVSLYSCLSLSDIVSSLLPFYSSFFSAPFVVVLSLSLLLSFLLPLLWFCLYLFFQFPLIFFCFLFFFYFSTTFLRLLLFFFIFFLSSFYSPSFYCFSSFFSASLLFFLYSSSIPFLLFLYFFFRIEIYPPPLPVFIINTSIIVFKPITHTHTLHMVINCFLFYYIELLNTCFSEHKPIL